MSLKAKVEAIIYAAEEPITVEQISQLLRDQILAEAARLEAEAQAAAEAKAAEEAQNAAEATTTVVQGAVPAETTESATTEDNNPALSVADDSQVSSTSLNEHFDELSSGTEAPAVSEESESETCESVEAAEASTPAVDEGEAVEAPVDAPAEPVTVENATEAEIPALEATPAEETSAERSATNSPADAVEDEPAPAESASVDAPAGPGKRQKKTKEELAVDAKVRAHVRALIAELIADYANEERGIEVRQVAGGYRMSTKPEHHDVVRAFAKSLKPPVRLSLAALETLAVIAYKQPITVPEISEIRGVESGGVIATLLDRKLITTAGRKQVIGRPILYKTAKEFLLRFGLNDVSELPSMEEFEKLAAEGLGVAEEQTSLDLQPQSSEANTTPGTQAQESTGALNPEDGLNVPSNSAEAEEAPTVSASDADLATAEEPAAVEAAENAAPQTESATAEETPAGTETEEPQHS